MSSPERRRMRRAPSRQSSGSWLMGTALVLIAAGVGTLLIDFLRADHRAAVEIVGGALAIVGAVLLAIRFSD